MRPLAVLGTISALFVVHVRSQITTTTIDQLGETVVEVITTDPVQGIPVTQTIATLTSTTTPVPVVGQQGPVGQPEIPQGQIGGPTPFTYTTTDAAGDTIAVPATFTPSFAPTTGVPTTPPSGTILDYSSWRASIGTNTVAVVNAGLQRWSLKSKWGTIGAALCAGLTGGAYLAMV